MIDDAFPYRFEALDRVCINGADYVYVRRCEAGHVMRQRNSDIEETFSHVEMAKFVRQRSFRHDRRFYAEGNIYARETSKVSHLNDLPPEERETVMWRFQLCKRFLQLEAEGKATRSDASMKRAVQLIWSELVGARINGE